MKKRYFGYSIIFLLFIWLQNKFQELLQNAEDAGARSVKMGLCPSCRSDHLPDPYKKYMSVSRLYVKAKHKRNDIIS